MTNNAKTLLAFFVCSIFIVGCGDKDASEKALTQVVAKVNDKEITVMQLNHLLSMQESKDDETKQQILDKLIEQEILVQKGEELKLDRRPEVLQAIEFAKRQALAQAVIDSLVGKYNDVSSADIQKYYNEHGSIFANHYVFDLDVFLLDSQELNEQASNELESSSNGEQTKEILQRNKIRFKQNQVKRGSELIPAVILDKLTTVNNGDIIRIPDENKKIILMQLISKKLQPISEQESKEPIRQLLINERAQTNIKQQLELMKKSVKIEYLQHFSSIAKTKENEPDKKDSLGNEHIKSGVKGLN